MGFSYESYRKQPFYAYLREKWHKNDTFAYFIRKTIKDDILGILREKMTKII